MLKEGTKPVEVSVTEKDTAKDGIEKRRAFIRQIMDECVAQTALRQIRPGGVQRCRKYEG